MIAEDKIHDLLEDNSFRRYVAYGEYAEKWSGWQKDHPEYKREFKIAFELIENLCSENQSIIDDLRRKDIKNKIRHSLTNKIGNNSRISRRIIWKVAAAFLILFTSLSIIFLIQNDIKSPGANDSSIQVITKHNPRGIKSIITFSDGSKAYLNAESEVRYPQLFSESKREVALKGEAYFEINRDVKRPFIIHSENIIIEVLGTKFNVNAYPENNSIQVALISGKVAVNAHKGDKIILAPLEMLNYSFTGKDSYDIVSFEPENVIGWKDGILIFRDESISNIFQKLERWYGVNIIYNRNRSIYSDWGFTGKFENRSLEYILNTMNHQGLFEFTIEKDKVIIK